MTLPSLPEDLVCAICGTTSRHSGLMSTNTFGPPDLDTRPAQMRRSTMNYWLQQCPHCGYCADPISKAAGIERTFVDSDAYQAQRTDHSYPPLANAFLCKSMLEEHREMLTLAAWSSIHAAWVCDDFDRPEPASTCRRRALHLREIGIGKGQRLSKYEDMDFAIAADLLRRIGDHQSVIDLVTDTVDDVSDETVRKILEHQRVLASRRDSACYTVEDALESTR